jgi:hypothetical protein
MKRDGLCHGLPKLSHNYRNFPFTRAFWTGKPTHLKTAVDGDVIEKLRIESDRDQSVRIHKMTKIYKTTTAVKELSLAMTKGNVYALLGIHKLF